MKLKVILKKTSEAIEYINIKNCYEKGSFYCIWLNSNEIVKYPIQDIFRVHEYVERIPSDINREDT